MIPVCRLEDLPVGESVRVDTTPPVAVFNADGELYAIDDTCTHQDASSPRAGWRAVWSNARCTPPHSISVRANRRASPHAAPSAPTASPSTTASSTSTRPRRRAPPHDVRDHRRP